MDKMCYKSEVNDFTETDVNTNEAKTNLRCESPVFKCVSTHKSIRSRSDSSDYDIPSYQVNQSVKRRTSSNYENEEDETFLLFSPVVSPIHPPATQCQPPSIHSLGTIVKRINSGKNVVNIISEENKLSRKKCNVLESLGMTDKDISWVSSMASPLPNVPETGFNTIEKATFFPEDKFQNIQPRALFSPTHDDEFGCQPLSFSSESEDEEGYKTNIRLSDVCASLKLLEVRSFDQSVSDTDKCKPESSCLSPVIKTKKKKSENTRKRKNAVLVQSPKSSDDCEFSKNNQDFADKTKSSISTIPNFIDDDSFQSISFSGIDELCKTLVNATNSSAASKTFDCDGTLLSHSCEKSNSSAVQKCFYSTKTNINVYLTSDLNNLHSYAQALEEANVNLNCEKKIEKNLTNKGIVRFDMLDQDSAVDGTKRLYSTAFKEENESSEKKFKDSDDGCNWDEMKQYLSESQLNVSDSEIFKTVENLEKTLASQEEKELMKRKCTEDLFNIVQIGNELHDYEVVTKTSELVHNENKNVCTKDLDNFTSDTNGAKQESSLAFKTASGSRIPISDNAITKAQELFKTCEENSENFRCSTGLGKKINVSKEALEKAKNLMLNCEGNSKETRCKNVGKKIDISPVALEKAKTLLFEEKDEKDIKIIKVSPEALERAKSLMSKCEDGKLTTKTIKVSPQSLEKAKNLMLEFNTKKMDLDSNVGFCTVSGKTIQVSSKALEKAKLLMNECDEISKDSFEKSNMPLKEFRSFSTCLGKTIKVSSEALEKAKALLSKCDENKPSFIEKFPDVDTTTFPATSNNIENNLSDNSEFKVEVSNKDSEKGKASGNVSKNKKFTNKIPEVVNESLGVTKLQICNKIPIENNSPAKNFLNTSNQSFALGFSKSSGNRIEISKESLAKAKAFMSEIDEESKNEPVEENKCLNPLPTGFLTGLRNRIEVSKEHLEKAKALMSREDEKICDVPREDKKSNFPIMGFFTGLENQEESVQEAKELMSQIDEESWNTAGEEIKLNVPTFGFLTGLGNKIEVSKESMEKAKAFLSKLDEESCDLTIEKTKLSNHLPIRFSSRLGNKTEILRVKEPLEQEIENTNLSNSLPLGFSTASENKIKVPEEFLEKAKALVSKADAETQGAEGKEKDYNFSIIERPINSKSEREIVKKFQEKSKMLISKTEEVEKPHSKAIEESKLSNLASKGFTTASGTHVTISEEALIKARENMTRWEVENNPDLKSKSTEISKVEHVTPDGEESSAKNIDISDWDEIIPSWLHVYNTSPSIASDRIELSPIASDANGMAIKPNKEYVCKSPVLGAQDRFYRKIKRKKLQFDEKKPETQPTIPPNGFVVPYNTKRPSGTKESTKRTSSICSMDFSVPFKRAKLEKEVSETTDSFVEVLEKRAKARAEQEKIAAEKQKVRPLKGSHLLKKSTEKQIKFIEGVKKSLPGIHTDEDLEGFGVKKDVLSIKVSNAANFKFNGFDFFGSSCITNIDGFPVGDGCVLIPDDDNNFGVDEFKRSFLASPGVQPNLIPVGWLENHYKWIVWKLAHYERSFPRYFAGKCLTPHNTMVQLKYRYDREIDRSERSVLKKILERDDTAAKRMVLCVCGIKKIVNTENTSYELDLTDGWYSCPARVDSAMTRLIEEGKVTIGTKLVTQGATLFNCEQGISPLEIGRDVYLRISTNSTRRVRWHTKLGLQKNPENFITSLGSILPQGGSISRLNVIVVRIYPILYMEKVPDGHHVTRNLRLEEKAEAEYRKIQERKIEMICNEIQNEMQKSGLNVKKNLSKFNFHDDCSQLIECSDPSTIYDQNDRLKREFNEKIEEKLKKEKFNKRNVTEFLRVKIVDLKKPDYNNPAVLSVWNPNEDILSLLTEGKAFSITNISMGNSRSLKPIQINTTRATQFKQIIKSINYPARTLTRLRDVSGKISPIFEEIDVVGIVSKIQNVAYGSRLSQVVYLTDGEFNFVGILFWGTSKDYGWESVLQLRSIVACSNLQWKKNHTVQEVPSLHVNENSVFTENPKHVHLKEEIEKLKRKLPQDLNSFFSKCDEDLTIKLEETKWRNNTSGNSSANDSMSRNSNLERIRRENRFESKPSASSTPLKPFRESLCSGEPEPSPIQKKMEKLESYGDPPPLLPLIVSHNQRKLRRKTQTERESSNR